MKIFNGSLVVVLVTWFIFASNIQAQPTIYIVRHAEKLTNWPSGSIGTFQPLSAEGIDRAEKLTGHFDSISLKAIYSSMTTRTLHTVFPLSQKLNIPIKGEKACMDTSAIEAFFNEIHNLYDADDSILLVSHSNIIPYLLIKAGLPEDCQERMGLTTSPNHSWILIEGYENMWIVEGLGEKKNTCKNFKKIKY